MKHFATISLIVFLLPMLYLNGFSQTDTTATDQSTNTSKSVSEKSNHSMYTGIGYGSSRIYEGSAIPQNQTFGYAILMYVFKNEFYASTSVFRLPESKPLADIYSYSLNYTHSFKKRFDISATIARFQFAKGLTDTILNNITYGDLTLGTDWRLFLTNISLSGLYTDKTNNTDLYFQVKNSRYFQTPDFFKGKAFVSFNPYINLMAGPRIKTKISTVISETKTLTPSTLSDSQSSSENGNTLSEGSLFSSSLPSTTTTTSVFSTTSYTKKFGMLEINLGLPIALNFKSFSLQAETGYTLPVYSDIYLPRPKGFFFMFSGLIRIF
jgi:hypothetical protein